MAKRRRRARTIEDGPLREIYKYFFKPIVDNEAVVKNKDTYRFMEEIFDTTARDIDHWQATKPFKMPGLFYSAPNVKVFGSGYRKIKVGTLLMARHDKRSDFVDVEFLGGRGSKDQVFNLTHNEWEWTKLHLKSEGLRAPKLRHRNRVRRPRM